MWWTIAAVCAAFLAAAATVYYAVFYNGNRTDVTYKVLTGEDYDPYHEQMLALIRTAVTIPFEPVRVRSFDGRELVGKLYRQDPKAPVHIAFNGYKGNGIRDFSGGMQLSLSRGDNVLLVDQRAHGDSQGRTISFGVQERWDVPVWIERVRQIFGTDVPIYLEGVSMGAATVLMASNLPLSGNVRGIIADCPYSAPIDILKRVAGERLPYAAPFFTPLFVTAAWLFGHFRLFATSAVKAVAETDIPILIIHGTGDHYVPVDMSRRIRDAHPDLVTLVEVEGAPHGLSCLKDGETYRAAVDAFMARTLPEPALT